MIPKRLLQACLLITAICFCVLTLLSFSFKPFAAVSFSIVAGIDGSVNTGTFTSSGSVSSTGTFEENYSFNGKKSKSEVVFTSASGTLVARTNTDITFTDAQSATGTGKWVVVNASGIYAALKGSGDLNLLITNHPPTANTGDITQEWTLSY